MEKMFKAGVTYNVYLLSGAIRKFKCTRVDLDKMIVFGCYEGGKEKSHRVMPRWGRLLDKQEGKAPDTYAIEINKRNGTDCVSEDYVR